MKIKLLNNIILIDILTILLVLAIIFIPSNVIRIVIGLPFLLFFPGYTLVAALFAKKGSMDGIERVALSFGMSIVVVALLGLALNYTPLGIRLYPVLGTVAGFIFLMSGIALWRNKTEGFIPTYQLKFPGWSGSAFNKTLTVILVVAVLGTIGVLGYAIAKPKTGEKFTEFYILGKNNQADNYPVDFILKDGRVTSVSYDGGRTQTNDSSGRVTLGIVNQEQRTVIYSVSIQIDGQTVDIEYDGNILKHLDAIEVTPEAPWEKVIGFTPQRVGNSQKVEFFLYKDGSTEPESTLHLWVNVKGQ